MKLKNIVNLMLSPFDCKIVRITQKVQHDFDPLERNDVKTLEKLWGDPAFRKKYLSKQRQGLYEVVLSELQSMQLFDQDCRLLDMGCGPGFFPKLLHDKNFVGSINGCDFSSQAISLSSSLIPTGTFFQHDIYNPVPEKYDIIVCMETIEHILHPEKALLNLADAAPNLILTVPEGRKDSFQGHVNLWTKQSFEIFLGKVLPQKKIEVSEVANEKNLLARIS